MLGDVEYNALRSQVLDTRQARRRPRAERSPRDHDRHEPAAARPRLGAVHARPDAGARRRDARHRQRRAAPRLDRRAGRDDEVVHAALQLPAVLHRRSAPDARHAAVARSATATSPSARCRACCRRSRSSRTRSASSRTSSSRTARRRWRRCAAARSRCSTPASRCAAPSPAWRWGSSRKATKYAILTDILGTEDHLGDMDFKVAGHRERHHLDPDGHQDRGARPRRS